MNVIIIDDHPVVRYGIRAILETEADISVCAEAEDADTAMRLIEETKPDVAIVDIELKGNVNGIQLIMQIRQHFESVRSLVMSMDDGSLYALRAMRAGAKGYVAKEEASERIVSAIRSVMRDEVYLSTDLAQKLASGGGEPRNRTADVSLLSNREFQIFRLIGQGYKRSEISKETGMNINTIESHRRNIREKLSLKNSAELSRLAVEWYASKKQ
ncbi:MAG: response regulator [Spirochaetota bacterium]